jgi:hypothetical protein
MARGEPHDQETRAKFRAHYLYSGNAARSAKELGIPERTGQQWAESLGEEPAFAEDRRKLRARSLDELVAMRMNVARTAWERYEHDEANVEQFGENVTVIDKRQDYGKLILDAEKNAHNLAKIDAGNGGDESKPTEVNIRVFGPEKTDAEQSSGS